MRTTRVAAVTLALAGTLTMAGCGTSGDSGSGGDSSHSGSSDTGSSDTGSSDGGSSGSAFCRHINPDGSAPAGAFMAYSLWQPKTAHKAAVAQLSLMQGATPPAEIKKDWATWLRYTKAVVKAGAAGDMSSLSALEKSARKPEKALTAYAFAHCKG